MPGKYKSTIADFLGASTELVLGHLALGVLNHQLRLQQRQSWAREIDQMQKAFAILPTHWTLILEYPIPRRAKRADVVLLAEDVIFVIEFKDRSDKYEASAIAQVEDYALDIRDFHKASAKRAIVPIVWASGARPKPLPPLGEEAGDWVKPTFFANNENLGSVIREAFQRFHDPALPPIAPEAWDQSAYLPTPTIIEAAQHLFAQQDIREISRSHAGSENLTATTDAVLAAIRQAQAGGEKVICFITGVPGAGKTLAGLNIVHSAGDHAGKSTFLSGNAPLIKVLTEALSRAHARKEALSLKQAVREVAFIQNVHQFLEHYHHNSEVPQDKIVLFDEAQRAWNAEHSKRKFNRNFSEAEMLFGIMDRHDSWAVIVALVGSGQEINTGEAGLAEWGRAIKDNFSHWKTFVSPELKEGASLGANDKLFDAIPAHLAVQEVPALHLKVSIRAFKAEKLSEWVAALLDDEPQRAKALLDEHLQDYPIFLTRDLDAARTFLRRHLRGSRRAGLVASSGARRLRPLGLDVSVELDVAKWFLNPKDDVRSSSFLELPATEFAVQGLELDWVGLCWGGDFRKKPHGWSFHAFKGSRWQNVRQDEKMAYIKNKYRVLLTRAREGLVIFVPQGLDTDNTRSGQLYDGTYEYLSNMGLIKI